MDAYTRKSNDFEIYSQKKNYILGYFGQIKKNI